MGAWQQASLRVVLVVNDAQSLRGCNVVYMKRTAPHIVKAAVAGLLPPDLLDAIVQAANGDVRFAKNLCWLVQGIRRLPVVDTTPHAMFDASNALRGLRLSAPLSIGWVERNVLDAAMSTEAAADFYTAIAHAGRNRCDGARLPRCLPEVHAEGCST